MQLIIDRFEGSFAICENEQEQTIEIEKKLLPVNAKEGDVIMAKDGKYSIDQEATKKRKNRIKNLMDQLWD